MMLQESRKTLSFPKDREYKVSENAISLMLNLLQEKEHRLSSKKYLLNDYQHNKHSPGRLVNRYSDPNATDYRGRFVYPDDATDIKAHPFFSRIAWDRHHVTRPPFVPNTNGREDTKYFDEDDPVSDVNDAESQVGEDEAGDGHTPVSPLGKDIAPQLDGITGGRNNLAGSPEMGLVATPLVEGKQGKGKIKKRPRDKVLRDREIGRQALEIRKQGAFVGYTYKRPKLFAFNDDRGRQRHARRSLLPSFEGAT